MDGEIGSIGTDGQGLYFHPGWLGGAYREDRKNVNRAYLHIVLHCLFGHLYLRGKRDPLFWIWPAISQWSPLSTAFPATRDLVCQTGTILAEKGRIPQTEKQHKGADSPEDIQKPDSMGNE